MDLPVLHYFLELIQQESTLLTGGSSCKTFDFCLWITNSDQHLVPALAAQIFATGHSGAIVAVSDGPVDVAPLKKAGVKIIVNQEKIKPFGSKIIERNYSQLLSQSDADGFIQVDPDSAVWWLPPIPKSDWAGALIQRPDCTATWGCGTYYSRRLLEFLVSRPIADSETISYEKGPSRDLTMAAILNAGGFKPEVWLGPGGRRCVDLSFKSHPSHRSGRWAITHPRSVI
jgi:hypothetical protein